MADVNVFIPPGLPVGPGGAATSTVSSGAVVNESLEPLFSPSTAPPAVVSSGPIVPQGGAAQAPAVDLNVATVRPNNGNVFEQIPPQQRVT
jgi:hypothetical protein